MSENKSSKKTTIKGTDLPEAVEWLIKFVNIGSKPGKVSLMKVGKKNTLNRPPSEPGVPIENLSENNFIDENNNLWNQESEKLSFLYSLDDEPSPEELRDFLFKTGIDVGSGYSDAKVEWAWFIAICTLHSKYASGISTDFLRAMAQSFVSDYYNQEQIRLPIRHRKDPHPIVNGIQYLQDNTDDPNCLINGIKYSHDNTLEQVICAYALDFWHNHRELHKRLRQCPCCGKFEIIQVTKGGKGRKRIYCSNECEDRFNQPSRPANKTSKASSRKWKKQAAKKEIIDWLCEIGFSSKEAKEEYEKERKSHPNNVASLKAFQNTYARRTNLI